LCSLEIEMNGARPVMHHRECKMASRDRQPILPPGVDEDNVQARVLYQNQRRPINELDACGPRKNKGRDIISPCLNPIRHRIMVQALGDFEVRPLGGLISSEWILAE